MNIKKTLSAVLACLLLLTLLPASAFAVEGENAWAEPGNSSLNILNGGVMLTTDSVFYYTNGGIYKETLEETVLLTGDNGKNLNLSGGWLWYTLEDGTVCRISPDGGEPETVFAFGQHIKQLYVIGDSLRFLAGGNCYTYSLSSGEVETVFASGDIMGLIPTIYGNVFLRGSILDYDLYADETPLLSHVMSAYEDSGYLAVCIDNKNYQVELSRLFNGFTPETDLEAFCIHGEEPIAELLGVAEEGCEHCEDEANIDFFLMADERAPIDDGTTIIPTVSQGQLNMVKRARQMHEIAWTPLADRYQWGYRGIFAAGVTITGLPYGQPVNNAGYVGYYGNTLETFANAVADNTSVFYSGYSNYNKIAPYYSTDCSGFVSYVWGLTMRHTTYTWAAIATRVSDQSVYSLQVGDALNHSTSHIVFVSDVQYDSDGNIVRVTIMEQTPVKTKLTNYGAGCTYPLSRIQSYYLSGGYAIYRYENRDEVTYTHSCAVPIDGDYCANCKATVPGVREGLVPGGRTVTLTHSDSSAAIYYTLDGSTPTTSSTRYTGPITLTTTATVKAMATTSRFWAGRVLTYRVTVPPVSTPTASVSGISNGIYVQSGAKVTLSSTTAGTTLYYTLDGSTPTIYSTPYTSPITITGATTIKVIGSASGYTNSAVATFNYQIGNVYSINASAGTGGVISPSGTTYVMQGGSQTYTISAKTGFAISDVKVDGVSKGKISSYTFSDLAGNHSISATFTGSSTLPFTDVSVNSWYYPAISYTYANNLFIGTSSTTFNPEGTMTRAMFVTVLGRLAGMEEFTSSVGIVTGSDVNVRSEPNTSCAIVTSVRRRYTAVQILSSTQSGGYTWYYIRTNGKLGYMRGDYIKPYTGGLSDLTAGQYYTGYVEWAYLTGILSGVASGSFYPNSNISREEMAILMYNYTTKYGITLPNTNTAAAFTDIANCSATARNAITALQHAGVINGMGNGTYDPKGYATRAHVAQIYMNFKLVL